jgi:pimeloyl-ACP methyl ester carboxylesterase
VHCAADSLRPLPVQAGELCGDQLFASLVDPLQYPWTAHTVVTEDGFKLKLYRIQAKRSKITQGKKVVFLQHGLMDSSDSWLVNGEDRSLGFVLANAGYDVWLGNSRGNKYSRNHREYQPEDKEFWDFSFQEMGRYDVPANINFILKTTGQEKLTYIGHSQGTTQMFAGLSDPATALLLNNNVNKFIALAPVVYLPNQLSGFLKTVSKFTLLTDAANLFRAWEWLPGKCTTNEFQTKFQTFVCEKAPGLCNIGLSLFDRNPRWDDERNIPMFIKHMPSGTSLRTIIHFQQNMNQADPQNPRLTMFDFGTKENLLRYKRYSPEDYDFRLITTPVRGFVCKEDTLGNHVDNSILERNLLRLGKDYKAYNYDGCGHMTFMWGINPSKIFSDVLAEVASA